MTRASKAIGWRESSSDYTQWVKGFQDVWIGLTTWRVWLLLGWQDIKLRYRRSHLGPFWITLSMGITVYSLGILYSHLWKTSYHEFMLYFASGLLAWTLISTVFNESIQIFHESKGYILQIKMPFTVYIMRLLVRNYIIFFHNILAVVPMLIYFHTLFDWHLLLLFPILALIYLPMFAFSMLIAMGGLRFRDIGQLITSLINLAFFVTPIMWMPNHLPARYHFVIDYNPFAQVVGLIRAPMLGQLPSLHSISMILGLFVIGMCILFYALAKCRNRIVFWL